MSELEAEIMLPGHGYPMFGKENIQKALTTTAEFLDDIENQVMELMNQGKTLNFIIHKLSLKKN